MNQNPAIICYSIASGVLGALDVLAFAMLLFAVVTSAFIGSFLLMPAIIWFAEILRFPVSDGFGAFADDAVGLLDDHVVRVGLALIPIVFVLIRERNSRPFRTWSSIFLAMLLAMPAILFLVDLVLVAVGSRPYAQSFTSWLQSNLGVTGNNQRIPQLAVSFFYFSMLLSGLVYIPYFIIHAVFWRRIGPPSAPSRRANPASFLAQFLKNFGRSADLRQSLAFLVAAVISANLPIFFSQFETPAFFLRIVVDLTESVNWADEQKKFMLAGFAAYSFWPVVLSLALTACYLLIARPRWRSFLTYGATLPILVVVIVLSGVLNPDQKALAIAGGIIVSIWHLPVAGFFLAAARYGRLAVGHSRNLAIKATTADHNPYLLLRAFTLDQTTVRKNASLIGKLDLFRWLRIRLEEVVAREAFLLGPITAVANPSETSTVLGAMREYLTDDSWQPFVSDRILSAERIIFVLGRGNYTGWETEQLVNLQALDRTIFVVPPDAGAAQDYLSQNPEVEHLFLNAKARNLLDRGRVRCFYMEQGRPTVVSSRFTSEVAYTLAIRRALTT